MPSRSTRYTKSLDNQARERSALGFVLDSERRFQRPDRETKRRILELLSLPKGGEWTDQTFDLVLTPPNTPPLTAELADTYIDEIYLVEVKATKKPIRNTALNGFFFGTTDRQYQLARAAHGRYRYAFIVDNSDNDYGRPFYVLLTLEEVEEKTASKRLQYQVSFRREMTATHEPSTIPQELMEQAKLKEAKATTS
jgi:hypothetical protein